MTLAFIWFTLFSCGARTQFYSEEFVTQRNEDIPVGHQSALKNSQEIVHNVIHDSLRWHLSNHRPVSKALYKRVDEELTGVDEVFVKNILNKVKSLMPVITVFKTVESDQEKDFVDIHLFDDSWRLRKSLSLKYDISYDLYSQDYQFQNDSIFDIFAQEGMGFDTDDRTETRVTIKIDEIDMFDTVRIRIDTVKSGGG